MKALLETSTLTAALLQKHTAHDRAFPWLKQVHTKEVEGVVAAHTLAELYAVLTRYPIKPPLTPAQVRQMIERDILAHFTVITLSADDYRAVLEHLSQKGLAGGIVYDALIAQAAVKAGADQLVTLNAKDFLRAYPGLTAKIVVP